MPTNPLHSERDLIWVVQVSSALSLGTLAGLLYSISAVNPSIRFHFSLATLLAFLLAALASFAFWHVVFALNQTPAEPLAAVERQRVRSRKIWMGALAAALAIALIFAFIYPLRGFSGEKQSEVSFGAMIAVAFLTVLGLLFWRVVRFLERVP